MMITPLLAHGEESLKINDQAVGEGAEAVNLSKVAVDYTGWLLDGTKFDSSIGRKPFTFTLGGGDVIAGWDQGVLGMRVGGKRELIIPPHLAYGARGAGRLIRLNSTLRLEIELLSVSEPKFKSINNARLKELLAKGVKIVDVRHLSEWQETGVAEGSKLMEPFKKSGRLRREFIKEFGEAIKKDEEVILICSTGNRTGLLSEGLTETYGYTNIYNVTKGIEHWISEGNPVVKP